MGAWRESLAELDGLSLTASLTTLTPAAAPPSTAVSATVATAPLTSKAGTPSLPTIVAREPDTAEPVAEADAAAPPEAPVEAAMPEPMPPETPAPPLKAATALAEPYFSAAVGMTGRISASAWRWCFTSRSKLRQPSQSWRWRRIKLRRREPPRSTLSCLRISSQGMSRASLLLISELRAWNTSDFTLSLSQPMISATSVWELS
jgi:hypothetical protein